MTPASPITSNDPALAARVSAWLSDSGLPMPPDWSLRVDLVDTIDAVADSREVFAVAEVDVRAGEPLGWVHLTWRHAPAWARVEADRPHATVKLTPAAVAEWDYLSRSLLLATLIFMCKRDGRYHVHAGTMVDPQGRGWMLAGNSCSGKSTTTALHASLGWLVSTDDIAFLHDNGGRVTVTGFRDRIALRAGGAELVKPVGGVALGKRGKTGISVEELGTTWVQSVTPDIVVFTAVGGERTTLTLVPPVEALKRLMTWSLWVMFEPTAAQEHLDMLAQLARQARCYSVTLAPDLFQAPGGLGDFLP